MNIHKLGTFLSTATVTFCLTCFTGQFAQAATLHNDWYYAKDSATDGIAGESVGGTKYEIYGMAIKQTAEQIFVAINSNMSLYGVDSAFAHDGHVNWGDLLFNFSGQNLSTASANGSLFGIRFANNESGVTELGVYSNVKAKDVAKLNGIELDNLAEYNDWVRQHGGFPSIGDLAADHPYFDASVHVQNIISSGTKIGDVNLLTAASLIGQGINFASLGATGYHTFGFSIQRSLLPDGHFIAHLAPECDNDIVAIEAELKAVPEPSSIMSLTALGLMFSIIRLRQRRQPFSLHST